MKKYLAMGMVGLCAFTMTARPAGAMVSAGFGLGTNGGSIAIYGTYLCLLMGVNEGFDGNDGAVKWFTLAGLLLLDSNGNPTADFAPMTEQAAAHLGVSAQELAAFNQELPEINAINESLTAEASARLAEGESQSDVQNAVRAQWSENKAALSPDAASALDKIGTALSTVK